MPIYYTADRAGLLKPNMTIDYLPLVSIPVLNTTHRASDQEHMDFLAKYYPLGISKHGERYLTGNSHRVINFNNNNSQTFIDVSHSIEATYEMARQIYAPEAPSRMTCMFATETVAEAKSFAPSARIYEVTPRARVFKADMNLLYFSSNMVETLTLAEKYWTQQVSSNPIYEVLIELPADIGSVIP